MKKQLLACLLTTFAVLAACGGNGGGDNTDAGPDPTGDGGGSGSGDGGGGGGTACTEPTPENPQCNDCIDNDNDGRIDGDDIECSGALDDDESSFATGIPGDNIDAVKQDCFFDGNSGAGDDGCNIHVCCILGAQSPGECPIGANQYDPAECPPPVGNTPLPQMCLDVCGPLVPPGCDCFGCCTICDPDTNQCYDIATNPSTSPNCDETNIEDPNACPRCEKVTSCQGGNCGGDTCVLCPGQDPNDLPAECMGTNQCPQGEPVCSDTMPCAEGTYCSNGCCIGIIL